MTTAARSPRRRLFLRGDALFGAPALCFDRQASEMRSETERTKMPFCSPKETQSLR